METWTVADKAPFHPNAITALETFRNYSITVQQPFDAMARIT